LLESDPGPQARQVAIALAERDDLADHAAVDQAEVAGVDGNVRVGDGRERAMKAGEHPPLPESFAAVTAHGIHDVVASLPLQQKP